jgi:hypothetical protein
MGKSKSRIFRKGINDKIPTISREEAIHQASAALNEGDMKNAKRLIAIFGLTAEELLEDGASYEVVKSIKNVFNND